MQRARIPRIQITLSYIPRRRFNGATRSFCKTKYDISLSYHKVVCKCIPVYLCQHQYGFFILNTLDTTPSTSLFNLARLVLVYA